MKKDELLRRLRPVTLADKPLFDRYLAEHPPAVSELTFTNVFCWAEVRHHLFCEHDGHLLITYRQGDCCLSFYPPVGPAPQAVMRQRFEGFRDYCWTRLDTGLATALAPELEPVLDRDNSDYVYRTQDLRELAGRAYHGKRNLAGRFEQRYRPEVRPLDASVMADCLHVQERWLEGLRHDPSARDESTALLKCLQHFEALGLRGVGVQVEGALVGFAVGEPLNPRTFVEHFEKALPGYTGAWQYLLTAFARSLPQDVPFLNREQDLGVEGLRRAKQGWHPVLLVDKYTLRIHAPAAKRSRQTPAPQLAGVGG